MTPLQYVIMMAAIAAILLVLMWWGWRGRVRRDADAADTGADIVGPRIERLDPAFYVSTTPVGRPFERIALPGLSYRGEATVDLHEDGVRITVRGERPVGIPVERVVDRAAAAARAGKAVERGGLSLLVWRGQRDDLLESTFRFPDIATRNRFEAAVDQLLSERGGSALTTHPHASTSLTPQTQEDA